MINYEKNSKERLKIEKTLILIFSIFLIFIFLIFLLIVTTTRDELEPKFPAYRFVKYTNHTNYSKELVPHFKGLFDGVIVRLKLTDVKINSDGFRDREYTFKKNESTFRIIVIGDSITFGIGVNLNETYPKQLERLLKIYYKNKNFEVLNFGVPGFNGRDAINFFLDKGLKYRPDMVIQTISCSDFEDSMEERKLASEFECHNCSFDEIKSNSIKVWEKLRDNMNQNMDYYFNLSLYQPIKRLSLMKEKEGFKYVIVYFRCKYLLPKEDFYVYKIKELNIDEFIDSESLFECIEYDSLITHPLDGHLNEKGNYLFARLIFTNLRPLIESII